MTDKKATAYSISSQSLGVFTTLLKDSFSRSWREVTAQVNHTKPVGAHWAAAYLNPPQENPPPSDVFVDASVTQLRSDKLSVSEAAMNSPIPPSTSESVTISAIIRIITPTLKPLSTITTGEALEKLKPLSLHSNF